MTRERHYRWLTSALLAGLALLGLLGAVGPAAAQTVTAANGQTCVGDRASNVTCTAGEFTTIVNITNQPGSPASCVAGEYVTLIGAINLSGTNADRYNVGFFTGENGNDPRAATGNTCSVAIFPFSPNPPWFAKNGDACGDYVAAGVSNPAIQNIKVLCAGDATGQLKVPYTLVYSQNAYWCTGTGNVTVGSPSKCNAGTAVVSTATFTVNGSVTVTKQTDPAGDAQSFAFTASGTGPVMSGDGSFSLVHNGLKQVRMGISDTAGTLTITEAATTFWEPTATIACTKPDGSSAAGFVSTNGATRTITATLSNANPNALCTITNTKRSRITMVSSIGSRVNSSDQFTVAATGGGTLTDAAGASISAPVSVTTTGTNTSASTTFRSQPAQTLTLTETAASGSLASYGVTYSCTNAYAGSSTTMPGGSGSSFSLTPAAGDDITCTFTNNAPPSVAIAFSPDTVAAYGTSTLTVTLTNPNSIAITGAAFTDTYPSTNLVNIGSASTTCGGTATGTVGASALSLSGGTIPANGSCTVSVSVASATAGSYPNSTGAVTTTNAGTNSTGASATLTVTAAVPAACNSTIASGVVNTYYPGTASVASGATSIAVGSATGAASAIAANDLLLIVQMQDENMTWSNNSGYSTISGTPTAGKYEYAVANGPVWGGSLSITGTGAGGGLVNSYTAAAYGSNGQKTFQVIRVPVSSSATLPASGLTALAWNGSTGGVLALDVNGALNLNGAVVDVSGKGFRGGGGCRWVGDNVTSGLDDSDYRRNASTTCPSTSKGDGRANGLKGEGIAGTPRYVYDGSARVNTGSEGYPNGSTGRGAPGNAGGGGTDDDPANNDENTGGGGGGGYGAGGRGGYAWSDGGTAGRGLGGAGVTQSAAQLNAGGGAGAGTSNNGTADGNGLNSSGVAGGGIIMLRAGSLTGSATLRANGADNALSVNHDGSGGGGGGGAILVSAASGISGLTLSVTGGYGGTNDTNGNSAHGPGGGGGGGYAITTAAPAGCTVTGGSAGLTTDTGDSDNNTSYGAGAGNVGLCATSGGLAASIPGKALGAGPCSVTLTHYAVSYPLGNPGVTCEALAVRISGHDAAHAAAVPPAATQITLSTAPATGGWALKSGGGTFTSPNIYSFDGTETYAEFWLTQTTPTASPHIDIDVTDGSSRTDNDGDAGEDAKAQFTDTAFKYYACTLAGCTGTCTETSINNQIAGKPSSTAPNAQLLCLRAVKKDTTTSACTGGLSGAQNVEFGYECDNPATCYAGNLMSINGGTATPIARNNDGTISASAGSYTNNVAMSFDTNGYAPFNLNYSDAGLVTLHARKTVTAGTGTPPSTAATLYGASNSFAVRPFAFDLTVMGNPKASAYDGTIFKAAGDDFDATVRGVVWQAADDDPSGTPAYDGLPNSGANLADNAVTPSYAWATGLSADGTAGSYTPLPAAGGVLGTLTATPAPATLAQASFSSGQASASGQATPFALTYSEVGSFTLKADATDYLGVSGLNVSGSTVVGRFTPHHFGLTGSVVTRSDLQAAEAQATPFTYMDEPMKLTLVVTAYNANHSPAPGVTKNYVGNFAKLDAATLCSGDVTTCATGTNGANWFNTGCSGTTQCMGLGAVDGSTGLSGRLFIDTGVASPTSSWATGAGAGVGTFVAHVKLARNATPDGPYGALKFGGMPRDLDGVTLPGPASTDTHKVDLDATTVDTLASNPDATNERKLIFTTKSRFGRLWIGNAYGSDKNDLTISFEAQYWNGNAFVTNGDDSLTSIAKANIGLGNHQPAGFSSSVDLTHVPAGPFTVASGKGSFALGKPTGATVAGSVDIVFDLGATTTTNTSWAASQPPTAGANLGYLRGKWYGSDYDRDPTARATFGVYGSNLRKGPIYIRENY